jgi:hypothetical protein
MPYTNQLFIGKITNTTPTYLNVVALKGNTILGQNTITGLVSFDVTYDLNLLRIGMTINTLQDGFDEVVTIVSIDSTTQITVSTNATSTTSQNTFTANTAPGKYLIQSASFSDPQNFLTVNDITGSLDVGYNETLSPVYGILGVAAQTLGGPVINGRFFNYKITEKVYNNISTAQFSAFIEWGGEGSELDSGNVLHTFANQTLAIGALSDISSYQNLYDPSLITGTPAGSGIAAYQIAIPLIDKAISTPFPFTGSAQITGSLAVTGSSKFIIPVGGIDGEFSIKSGSLPTSPSLFNVNGEGTIQFFAYDNSYTPTPILGGIYFTSESIYVGVE